MNSSQRITLIVVMAAIIITLLFPPFLFEYESGGRIGSAYGFLFGAPKLRTAFGFVNVPLLLTQWLGILICGVITWRLQRKPDRKGTVDTVIQLLRDYLKERTELRLIEADARIQVVDSSKSRPRMQPAIIPVLAISLLVAFSTTTAWANTATGVFEHAAQSIVVVQANNAKGKKQGMGSGVVIGKEEIVTNCHVIEDAHSYTVKHDERQYTARLKHADWTRDVCSLTVKGLNARVAPLGSTKRLKVGQKVFAIGAPQGLERTLSEGILSSLRELDGGRYLQISAPISPGSSGGGLFDDAGKLIGLPTFYLSEGQQLNFAVPVEWVQALPQRVAMLKLRTRDEWVEITKVPYEGMDWPELIKHSRDWAQAQPGEIIAWLQLGYAYSLSDEQVKAIEAFREALRIDPENEHAWSYIAIAYHKSNQRAKAIEAIQQLKRIDPSRGNGTELLLGY